MRIKLLGGGIFKFRGSLKSENSNFSTGTGVGSCGGSGGPPPENFAKNGLILTKFAPFWWYFMKF